MQAKSSSNGSNNNHCNQNKDAALLTLKPAQGQSTKSGHAHEFRHGGDDDGDGDDVALLPANGLPHQKASFPRHPIPTHSHLQEQR
ncbi:uncharacterized protein LOC108040480 [Drosophila rhopaloa]|uniref:Uncharacterized protein LOC108040480 n=1 Tax=Drosophila rhopaloa TaxID=1041015 RepID=A0A6P4EA77_DRORH|nr:uncharacterized protein LOC108040480 [Drosophila rhopaloa]